MVRPTTKPRVPALDPEETALNFVRAVFEHSCAVGTLLDPTDNARNRDRSDEQLKRTRLYRDLVRVATSTVRGEASPNPHLSRLLDQLAPLLQSPLLPHRPLESIIASIDPDEETDPVRLLLMAAMARAQLAEGTTAISSSQLAVVAGLTRRHVGAEIREGRLEADIAGRRGTAGAALIRPDEAQRWLRERDAEAIRQKTREPSSSKRDPA